MSKHGNHEEKPETKSSEVDVVAMKKQLDNVCATVRRIVDIGKKHFGKTFGDTGNVRVALAVFTLVMIATMTYAASTVWKLYDGDATKGTCKAVSDDAGAMTLTVDKVAVGESTVDSKYAIVGGDATTGLMALKGTFTNGQATVTFGTVFGAAPTVVCGWATDMSSAALDGTNCAIASTSVTASNFVPKISTKIASATYTNCSYIAIGTRP